VHRDDVALAIRATGRADFNKAASDRHGPRHRAERLAVDYARVLEIANAVPASGYLRLDASDPRAVDARGAICNARGN
jgi:hypothetical protein